MVTTCATRTRSAPSWAARTGLEKVGALLRERGMGLLLDFVPNHMGIEGPFNWRWIDVLENGPLSRYASFFDIHWNPRQTLLQERMLVPMLRDFYGRVLEDGRHPARLRRECLLGLLRRAPFSALARFVRHHSRPAGLVQEPRLAGRAETRAAWPTASAFIPTRPRAKARRPPASATEERDTLRHELARAARHGEPARRFAGGAEGAQRHARATRPPSTTCTTFSRSSTTGSPTGKAARTRSTTAASSPSTRSSACTWSGRTSSTTRTGCCAPARAGHGHGRAHRPHRRAVGPGGIPRAAGHALPRRRETGLHAGRKNPRRSARRCRPTGRCTAPAATSSPAA